MDKIKLEAHKQYLLRWNKPNSIMHGKWETGTYHESLECFNLNPTIHFADIDRCIDIDKILKLEHHEATTVGLWATDKPIKDLLHLFFNNHSDACNLEAGEQEDMEKNFAKFIETISFQIKSA